MSDIHNLRDELRRKAYLPNIQAAHAICKKVMDTLNETPNVEKYKDIEMEVFLNNSEVCVYKIASEHRGIISIAKKAHDKYILDLQPYNLNAVPMDLEEEDAKVFFDIFKGLYELYKTRNNGNIKPPHFINEPTFNCSAANSEQETKIIDVCVKIINTIKNLPGPKYNDLNASWHDRVMMVLDKVKPLIIILKEDEDTFKVSFDISLEPNFLNLDPALNTTIKQIWELVQSKCHNDFNDSNRTEVEGIKRLIDSLPPELKNRILERIFSRLRGD